MNKCLVLATAIFVVFGSPAIQADTLGDTGNNGSLGSSINNSSQSSVQIEPYSGSTNLSVPIQVPPGRAGIQPNISLNYSSSTRQLSNAGVGWTLDLGSIQISSKKGLPKYDGTDIFTMAQAGSTSDLVADPNNPGIYHPEVEGAFAYIQFFTDHWVVTDKKGIKYYYGNTNDSKQYDPSTPSHIFRWALNRVEDLNGNYMIISYLNDQGQIYPQTISYTGNDTASLNLTTYAQVVISYVGATQPSSSYISGFGVTTAQRIDHITTLVGADAQSTYTFTYKQSASTFRDLLQSIQQTGADGSTTLPAVKFSYSDTAPKGFQLDTSWNLSNLPSFSQDQRGIWQDLGVRVADFNGDAYPDIVEYSTPWGGSTTNQVFLNTKGKSWAATGNWQLSMTGNPSFTPYVSGFVSYVEINRYAGLSLLDVDGDGLPDIIQNFRRDMYYGGQYAQYQATNNGTNGFTVDNAWALPNDALIDYELGEPHFGYTVPGATVFTDINGDGYPDIAIGRPDWYPSQNVYINNKVINQPSSKGWILSNKWTIPSGVNFSLLASDVWNDNSCTMEDINGDGLSDIVCFKPQMGGNTIYLNNGSGWTLSPGYSNTLGTPDINLVFAQLIDVNGDGLPDIVIGTEHVLINTGNGWIKDDSWVPPVIYFPQPLQLVLDANADGMVDFIYSPAPDVPKMYVNQGKTPDLLVHTDNGVGGTTDIVYDSSAHYQNTYLPYVIPVVKSSTLTVGSETYTTTYNYSGGLWDKNYKEFDGFSTVTVTDPQGNYVTSTYLQDHWLKGHPSEQDAYDSQGNLYSKSVSQWQTQNIISNNTSNQISKFVFESRTDNYLYDGNSSATPKRTAQEFTYGENPQFGDVTQTINDGQVDPTSGNSIDANKTTTQISYVNNTNNWLIGLPAQSLTQDVNGQIIGKTLFYYDGDTSGSAVPSLGRLTAKVNWLGSLTQADPKTTYTYDTYGNLQTTTDPLGNTTKITYDNTVHMFPEQTTNASIQNISMSYYGIDGVSLDNGQGLHGLWGQNRSKTDANNQTEYTTFDTFGRASTSISPLDTVTLPTQQKIYNIQPTYSAITNIARVNSGSAATVSTVSYYDGLGRLIETKSLGPTAGQYIVSGQTEYNNLGLPVTKYMPHFTSSDLNTMDVIDTTVPNSQVVYDPMGRITTKTNPDHTQSSITYNQWTTTSIDENGHKQQSTVDAFGRLIQKQEYMGSNGRDNKDYPSTGYTLYATTNYGYNPRGNLISVTDAHNNVSSITYDNLGRKISMNDPDMGKWQYGYDSNGNLIWQQDAKGQVVSFQYDALNRLKNKTDAIGGPIVNLPNLTPQAATFNVNYNFDDQSQNFGIGRLGSVAYDKGTAGFVYDQVGREVSSNKNINGANYNVNRQYDALNRLQQLQYPDESQVAYIYNQAGQVTGVADAAAVVNGAITLSALNSQTSNDRLAWFDKALGVKNAYAATPPTPTVSISSPKTASTYTAGVSISIAASASETGGTISRVDFYNGVTLLGTSTTSPYNYAWTNVPAGNFSLTATATDSSGVSKTSSPIAITVLTPPTISITSPTSTALTLPANITVNANATASSGTISQVAFYNGTTLLKTLTVSPYTFIWSPTAGTYSLTAVAKQSNGATATSSPVSIAVSAHVAPTIVLTAPYNNYAYWGPTNIELDVTPTVTNATIAKVTFYNGTTVIGTATTDPYFYVWNNVGAGTYNLKAIVTDSTGATGTSSVSTVTVTHYAPSVSLTSPIPNASFTVPAAITLTASAGGSKATISKVSFYQGTTLLGTVTSPTGSLYSYTWNNAAVGTYNLTAVATDSSGVSTTSSIVPITINAHIAPTVTLVSPSTGVYAFPANITFSANATANNAVISKIAFYNGTTLLSTVTKSPYMYTWNNVPLGTYSFTAVATDSYGAVTTSSVATTSVTASNGPVVAMSSPGDGSNYAAGSNLTLSATATEANVAITNVSFYNFKNGKTLLGTSTSTKSPYSFTVSKIPSGSYILAAAATDANGVTSTSNPIFVSVTPSAIVVTMTSPLAGTQVAGSNILMTANASEANGSISKVDFYNGTAWLGTVTNSPYSLIMYNAVQGSYSLKAVATDATGATATSAAVAVTLTHLAPSVTLTSPTSTTSYSAPSSITLSANATAMDANVAKVAFYNGSTLLGTVISPPYNFIWNNVAAGTYSLKAIVTDGAGATGTSPIVPLTVSPHIAPTVTMTAPQNNSSYIAANSITLGAVATATNATITKVSFYSGTTLLGTATSGSYAYTWNNLVVGTYNLTAVATDSSGASSTSPVVVFTVTHNAPTVSLTSPTSNASYVYPASIILSANAVAANSTLTKVSFYNGTTLLGTATTSPYVYTWNNGLPGTYNLTAVATDSTGATTTSSVVSGTIIHVAPTVSLTAPANNAFYTAPASITLTATAAATNATVSKVAFYSGTTLLGTSTSSPYTYTWANPAIGNYNLTAVVTDSAGTSTTSSIVAVIVSTHVAPVVNLTSPSNNSSYTTPASITISANATATNATVTKVDFYNGTTLLGTSTSSPYTYTWANMPGGVYSLTVVATDSTGATNTSSAVNVTVTELLPTVSLAANSSTYNSPATVTLTATAAQVGGTISRVDFYNGTTLLGSATSSPYTYTWSNVATGNYSLTAQAYNNMNGEMTSAAISIKVLAPNVYIQSVNYNANGQIAQIQYGNGAVTAYTYDPLNFHLLRIYTSNAQATVIQDLNYTYDAVGQVLSINDYVNTASQRFTYDALNRLTSAQNAIYGSKTYAYDSIGNITLKEGLTYTYTGAGPHAVTSLSDGTVFQYDANGNMISMQKGNNLTQYVYDSQNRLQNVTVGGLKVADYAYDGDGGRVKKTVYRRDLALYNDNTNALLFGSVSNPLPATAQNPTIDTTTYVGNLYEEEGTRHTKFIYLGSVKVAALGSDGSLFYYHADHLGGANALTDNTGLARELTEYDPFGQVIKHEKYGNDFTTAWYYFSGKPLDDETGLIFLGARYYNPLLGRFITPDTVVQASSNPQTLNRYTYCNNNPVNLIDPTGHSWWSKFWKRWGDFISPFIRAVVTHDWADFGRIALATVGVFSGNPLLITASILSVASTATSHIGGNVANGISQGLGYASLAFAVVGGIQEISQTFSQAANATRNAQIMQKLSLSSDPLPSMSNMSPNELMGMVNNVSASVVDKTSAAATICRVAADTGLKASTAAYVGALGNVGLANNILELGELAGLATPAAPGAALALSVSGWASLGIGGAQTALSGNGSYLALGIFDKVGGQFLGGFGRAWSGFAEEAKFNWAALRYYSAESGQFVKSIYGQGASTAQHAYESLFSSVVEGGKNTAGGE